MAVRLVAVLLFALALSGVQLSSCHVLKGKLACLDCSSRYDFSGIKVLVKCDNAKRLATSTTKSDGSFEVELPSDSSSRTSTTPLNCLAKIAGGSSQLYASKKNMVSKIVKTQDSSPYAISTPLVFSTTSPPLGKIKDIGSSKTVDLPLPREWGLAPSSYYPPFIPIIGIP
ncbi:hypothetical protein P3X46_000028 [Hevea brasiliensis]|uniref:Pollen Ole e 1 allergen and extensin family protein n=1 Tax=Hevea brasiliensis TaxID=3981 RepID=A0ABQ9NA56_HEVBR|nr:uncharacterized protein LOC110669162 [Hevea brasiliensis]KAJ9188653.1 hypothetical protein P3X46_000028 [Hevea brasiliensis]